MNTFAFLLLAIQACFVQNVYSQYLRGAAFGPGVANLGSPCAIEAGIAPAAFAYPAYALEAGRAGPYALEAAVAPGFAYPAGLAGAYGGNGIGDVAVAGEMGVAGTTLVAGQVPILGAVRFGGDLPAAGTVTITGNCGCGGGAVMY